jgi:hypothetical protein
MSDPGTAHIVLARGGPPVPWMGQLVPIDVALWRPHTNPGELPPFSFDDLDVAGALALFRTQAPPPSELEVDGVLYLVQHRTLLVFPQTDGEIALPPVTARFDDPQAAAPVRVASEPLRFNVALPHGLKDDDALLVARGVTLHSETDRPLAGLAVGDGFTRSFVLSAGDTDPVMFPRLGFAEVPGLRVYPAEPQTLSTGERGAIQASQRFSATYVVERVGHYALPGPSLRWLDPSTGRYATAQVEALSFWAQPNFRLGLGAFGSAPGLGAGLALGAALLLALLGALAWRRLRGGPFAWERALAARFREQRAFLAFERALSHEAPLALLRRAYAWLALRAPEGPRTLAALRRASTPSAETLESWEERAFAADPRHAPAHGLHRMFVRARRALTESSAETSIGDINPRNVSRREKP